MSPDGLGIQKTRNTENILQRLLTYLKSKKPAKQRANYRRFYSIWNAKKDARSGLVCMRLAEAKMVRQLLKFGGLQSTLMIEGETIVG